LPREATGGVERDACWDDGTSGEKPEGLGEKTAMKLPEKSSLVVDLSSQKGDFKRTVLNGRPERGHRRRAPLDPNTQRPWKREESTEATRGVDGKGTSSRIEGPPGRHNDLNHCRHKAGKKQSRDFLGPRQTQLCA